MRKSRNSTAKNKNINPCTNSPKSAQSHSKSGDYKNAETLSQWLMAKYDMTYKAYRRKSKDRKYKLRDEFEEDTGIVLNQNDQSQDYEYAYDMAFLASIGVPFSPDGIPLGIEWAD